MFGVRATVHRQMVRALVSRAITCPRTGDVLDVRTCVVLLDSDGDPVAVVSQQGWRQCIADGTAESLATTNGVTPDPDTVKGA